MAYHLRVFFAVAYHLRVFFAVVGKPPKRVRPGEVLAFITSQRTGRVAAPGLLWVLDNGEAGGVSAATVVGSRGEDPEPLGDDQQVRS